MYLQKSKRRLVFLITILVIVSHMFSAGRQAEENIVTFNPAKAEPVVKWIAAHAFPLKTVEAGNGFEDLQPLKKILAGASLVGLGEATHGTREFFQCKHRLLEFLVKEMGFTVFGIEASYAGCFAINDYVLYGIGDRDEVLAGQGFWTWNTEEVAAMIDWMRNYNSGVAEERKIKFLGYDIQKVSSTQDLVRSYIEKTAPDYLERADAAMAVFQNPRERIKWKEKPEEEKNEMRGRLRELIGFLSFNTIRFKRLTSCEEFDRVLQGASILLQYYNHYSTAWNFKPQKELQHFHRDYYMAENIEYLFNLEKPGTKMVVWAHNSHIYKSDSRRMGDYLSKVFGERYYALGFVFNEGSFHALNGDRESSQFTRLNEFTFGPSPEGYLGWYFKKAGLGDCMLDLRGNAAEGAAAEFLESTVFLRSLGSMYSEKWPLDACSRPTVLGNDYDGMIFIDKTTRARPMSK